MLNLYSDGTLVIYNSADNPKLQGNIQGYVPFESFTLQFDSQQTDVQYLTRDCQLQVYGI